MNRDKYDHLPRRSYPARASRRRAELAKGADHGYLVLPVAGSERPESGYPGMAHRGVSFDVAAGGRKVRL